MKQLLIFLFLSAAFFSCTKEFIEGDLAGKSVSILAPADNDTVSTSTPLFWWNEIEDARHYRLQIAWPSFAAPQQLVCDTAVRGDRFYPSLQAGCTYEWRIRPENGSSEGAYVQRSLTIDSSAGLSNAQVIFNTPAASPFYTNSSTVSFTWNAISGATFYRINVIDSSDGSTEVSTTSLSPAFNYVFAPGIYRLQARAENSASFSPYSARIFIVDQTAPAVSSPQSPANNAFSVPSPVNFTWIAQAADRYGDSVFVSSDSTFATTSLAVFTTAQSYANFSANPAATYYWKLRTRDLAGNWSGYSARFKFTTQ